VEPAAPSWLRLHFPKRSAPGSLPGALPTGSGWAA